MPLESYLLKISMEAKLIMNMMPKFLNHSLNNSSPKKVLIRSIFFSLVMSHSQFPMQLSIVSSPNGSNNCQKKKARNGVVYPQMLSESKGLQQLKRWWNKFKVCNLKLRKKLHRSKYLNFNRKRGQRIRNLIKYNGFWNWGIKLKVSQRFCLKS